ncbi:phytase [Acanthocystis turfacea Chlorella virus MO0605SPH]|nr:phytase [Acanthocystis turfacea Chlorella virus MO0605SPH]
MAPIALCVHVPEEQAFLLAELHACKTASDFPGHERLAAQRALVVEEDAVAREHAICLTVVHDRPVCKHLCNCVRRTWMEGRRDLLRDFSDLAKELGGRCLVELC